MTKQIYTTEVQDWTSRTLKVFKGEKIDMALNWISEIVQEELVREYKIEDFDVWLDNEENQTIYDSFSEDYYIICRNKDGEELEFSF